MSKNVNQIEEDNNCVNNDCILMKINIGQKLKQPLNIWFNMNMNTTLNFDYKYNF